MKHASPTGSRPGPRGDQHASHVAAATPPPTATGWPLIVTLAVWVAVAVTAVWRYQPLAPIPADNRQVEFSADAAWEHLAALVGNDRPHPAGSEENARVADEIQRRLESLGYAVQHQSAVRDISPRARERLPGQNRVRLDNLIVPAVPNPTRERERMVGEPLQVLVVAHYDSHPNGPGAADNGVGVAAVIETARQLAKNPTQSIEVSLLFSDGEELGLLGASLFAAEHPLMDRIDLVINLDARGTSGASLMFETSGPTAALIPIFAKASRRPFASSLFYEIYRRLPRDTDFSVFKRAGVPGYNFAFIGDVIHYHTAADRLENVNRGSLQHHGENLLGLIRALDRQEAVAGSDWLTEATGVADNRVVYFDGCGWRLFWWPETWGKIAAAVLMLVWGGLGLTFFTGSEWRSTLFAGFSVLTAGMFVAVVGGIVLSLIRLEPGMAHPWPSHPWMLVVPLWLIGVAAVLGWTFVAPLAVRPAIFATTGGWVLLSAVTGFFVAGASFLFQIPAAAGLVTLTWVCLRKRKFRWSTWSPWWGAGLPIVAALIWLPLEPLFFDAVGFKMMPARLFRIALLGVSLLPLVSTLSSQRRMAGSLALIALAVLVLIAGMTARAGGWLA